MSNKFVLRNYSEHKSDINSIAFAPNKQDFSSCANETSIKLWNVLEHRSVMTMYNAHKDHVKKVHFLNENELISGSYDRTIKLWDLRNGKEPFAAWRFEHAVEDFCMMPLE